jgi:hypothetical protein
LRLQYVMNDGVRRRRRVQIDIAVGDVGTQYARQGTDLLARSGIDLFKPGESFPFGFGMMLENEIEEAGLLELIDRLHGAGRALEPHRYKIE